MVDKKKRNVAHLEAAMLICVQKIARYSHVIKIDQLLIRKARNQCTSFKPIILLTLTDQKQRDSIRP